MSKLRIVFIASLVLLAVLLIFTVFKPITSQEKFSTISRESIIQGEDEWVIQLGITNREGKNTDYTINWSTGGETYNSKTVHIRSEQGFTDIHHVYPETVKEGKLTLEIYKDDEPAPFEQSTYYIQFAEQ